MTSVVANISYEGLRSVFIPARQNPQRNGKMQQFVSHEWLQFWNTIAADCNCARGTRQVFVTA